MSQPENKQKAEEDSSDGNTLTNEIDSWNNFEYALREQSKLLFDKMLSECKENEGLISAANSKDEYFSAESLFMALILQQQRR